MSPSFGSGCSPSLNGEGGGGGVWRGHKLGLVACEMQAQRPEAITN